MFQIRNLVIKLTFSFPRDASDPPTGGCLSLAKIEATLRFILPLYACALASPYAQQERAQI